MVVQRSCVEQQNKQRNELIAGGILPVGVNLEQALMATTVLVLLNMVTLEELADDEEYQGVLYVYGWVHL